MGTYLQCLNIEDINVDTILKEVDVTLEEI